MDEDRNFDVFYSTIKDVIELYDLAKCCICLEILKNPVTTKCNHTFCDYCLKNSKLNHCPVCRKPVGRRDKRGNPGAENLAKFVASFAKNLEETLRVDIFSDYNLLRRLKSYTPPKNSSEPIISPPSNKDPITATRSLLPRRGCKRKTGNNLPTSPEQTLTDAFDALLESPLTVRKPVHTYTRKQKVNKTPDTILAFEDDGTRERIIQWLTDSQNKFDRWSQTQQGPVAETLVHDCFTSVSQTSKHSNYFKEMNKIKTQRTEFRRASFVRRRSKSLDIQEHSRRRRPERLLRQSIACDIQELEEVSNIEEIDSENMQVIAQLIEEEECLKNIEKEVVKSPDDLCHSKPTMSSGWERMQHMNKSIKRRERKPKKLKISLCNRAKRYKLDNSSARDISKAVTEDENSRFIAKTSGVANKIPINLKDMESFFKKHICDTGEADSEYSLYLPEKRRSTVNEAQKISTNTQKLETLQTRRSNVLDKSNERDNEHEFVCVKITDQNMKNAKAIDEQNNYGNKNESHLKNLKTSDQIGKDLGNKKLPESDRILNAFGNESLQNSTQIGKRPENNKLLEPDTIRNSLPNPDQIRTSLKGITKAQGNKELMVINSMRNKFKSDEDNTKIITFLESNLVGKRFPKTQFSRSLENKTLSKSHEIRTSLEDNSGKMQNLIYTTRSAENLTAIDVANKNLSSTKETGMCRKNKSPSSIDNFKSFSPYSRKSSLENFADTGLPASKNLSVTNLAKRLTIQTIQHCNIPTSVDQTMFCKDNEKDTLVTKNTEKKSDELQIEAIETSENNCLSKFTNVDTTFSKNNEKRSMNTKITPNKSDALQIDDAMETSDNNGLLTILSKVAAPPNDPPLFLDSSVAVASKTVNVSTESNDSLFTAPTQKLVLGDNSIDDFKKLKLDIMVLRDSLHGGLNIGITEKIQILRNCVNDLQNCVSSLDNSFRECQNVEITKDGETNFEKEMEVEVFDKDMEVEVFEKDMEVEEVAIEKPNIDNQSVCESFQPQKHAVIDCVEQIRSDISTQTDRPDKTDKTMQTSFEDRGFHITSNEFFKSPTVQNNESQTEDFACINCRQLQFTNKLVSSCKDNDANIFSLSPSFDGMEFDTQIAIMEHEKKVKEALEKSTAINVPDAVGKVAKTSSLEQNQGLQKCDGWNDQKSESEKYSILQQDGCTVTQILDNLQNLGDDSVNWNNDMCNQVNYKQEGENNLGKKKNEQTVWKNQFNNEPEEIVNHSVGTNKTEPSNIHPCENRSARITDEVQNTDEMLIDEVLLIENTVLNNGSKSIGNHQIDIMDDQDQRCVACSSDLVKSMDEHDAQQREDKFKRIRPLSPDSDVDVKNPKKIRRVADKLLDSNVSVVFDTESQGKNALDSSGFTNASLNMEYIDEVYNKINKGLVGKPGKSTENHREIIASEKTRIQEQRHQIINDLMLKKQSTTPTDLLTRTQKRMKQCDQMKTVPNTKKVPTQELLDKYDQLLEEVTTKNYAGGTQNRADTLIDKDVLDDLNRSFKPDDKESNESFHSAASKTERSPEKQFHYESEDELSEKPPSTVDKMMTSFNNDNDDDKLMELYKTNEVAESRKEVDIKVLQDVVLQKVDVPNAICHTDEDTDTDVIENTPEGPVLKNIPQRGEKSRKELFPVISASVIEAFDCTIPPPPEFQDGEDADVTLKENVPSQKQPDKPRTTQNVLQEVNSSNVYSENFISLSPIAKETVNKTLGLARFNSSKTSVASSTPKSQRQVSIRRFMGRKPRDVGAELFDAKTVVRKPCIACTRLSRDQVIAISALTNKKLATYSCIFNETVTHMVVSVNEKNCLIDHTIKYVSAVAAGIWVVSFKWVQECLNKNELVEEEAYEVLDVSSVPGPKVSRLNCKTSPLLKGFKIYVAPPFVSTTPMDVENIVLLLGGKVAHTPEELLDKGDEICLIITESRPTNEFEPYEVWLEAFKVVTVDIEWLSRSVGQFKLLSFRRFALCSDEYITELGYPGYLLENVPYSFSQATSI